MTNDSAILTLLWFLVGFIQPDDEKPGTSQQNDDESEDPDDLSDPLSSSGTDRGLLSY